MITISITEARRHLEKYIELCQIEDVTITRRGKPVVVMVGFQRWNQLTAPLVDKESPFYGPENQQMLDQINGAYSTPPTADEEETRKIMESHRRKSKKRGD